MYMLKQRSPLFGIYSLDHRCTQPYALCTLYILPLPKLHPVLEELWVESERRRKVHDDVLRLWIRSTNKLSESTLHFQGAMDCQSDPPSR